MKRSLLLLALIVGVGCFELSAQDVTPHYYVVIGAFRVHDNAIRFTDYANNLNFSTQYAINTDRNLYYVYILDSQDRREAFAFMLKIRLETEFKDAWVHIGNLGENPPAPETIPTPEPVVTIPEPEPVVVTPEPEPVEEEVPEPAPVVEVQPEPEPEPVPSGKPFVFRLINEKSEQEVLGEVHVFESANASQYQAFDGNELVYLTQPRNTNGIYTMTVQAPGYKLAKLALDFNNPEELSDAVGEKQSTVITFPLKLNRKGDYIEFNDVSFFRNTAIFEPTSRDELEGLAQLMLNEPKYKVKIHGHVNGKGDRDIVSMGTSTNYFDTEPSNLKENGTAQRLSDLRAEALKSFLVGQGVDAKRIKIKGEGGRMMIFSQTSTLSHYNDRVEVEVTSH